MIKKKKKKKNCVHPRHGVIEKLNNVWNRKISGGVAQLAEGWGLTTQAQGSSPTCGLQVKTSQMNK